MPICPRSSHLLRSHALIASAAVGALLSVGCSGSLTTLQPARTVPAGHVQATTSVQLTPPVGLARDTFEALQTLSSLDADPSADDLEAVVDSATAALVQPPSIDSQLGLAVGLSRRLELDARVGATSAGGGVRLQWLRQRPGIYGAIGFMANAHYGHFPIERFAPRVQVDRFRRVDYSVPLVLGYSRRRVHLWAGPKLVLSRYRARVGVCVADDDGSCTQEASLRVSGRARYLAGQVGIGLGSRRFWFAVEVTVARALIDADLGLDMPRRPTMEARRTVRGRVITPAIGLMLWL